MKFVPHLFLSVILLFPFIFSGKIAGYSGMVAMLLGLLSFVVVKTARGHFVIIKNETNVVFAIFLIIISIASIFTLNIAEAIEYLSWWLLYFVIFINLQKLTKKIDLLPFLTKTFVIICAVFSIFSLIRFIDLGLVVQNRLSGIIGPYNVYSGFLILPLLLSVYFIFKENGKWQRRGWLLASSVLLTSMILTFSYSAWLSIFLAGLFSIILFWQRLKEKISKLNMKILSVKVILLASIAFIVFCGVWYMAKQPKTNIDLVEVATITTTSELADWLPEMLDQGGVIVTVAFTTFILFMFWNMARMIGSSKRFSWFTLIIFTALSGSAIHGLLDADWNVNWMFVVFFVFSALLHGHLLKEHDENKSGTKYFFNWISYIILVITIIVSIITIQFLRADMVRERGDKWYFIRKDSEKAIESYFESITYNSHDHLTWYSLWRVYYDNGQYELAENSIKKAIRISKENDLYIQALIKTEKAKE